MTQTDAATTLSAEVEAAADTLIELHEHRARERALLADLHTHYVAAWRGGLPKTGDNGVAAAVRAELRRRGWTDVQMQGLGVSSFNVRLVLDRAEG